MTASPCGKQNASIGDCGTVDSFNASIGDFGLTPIENVKKCRTHNVCGILKLSLPLVTLIDKHC